MKRMYYFLACMTGEMMVMFVEPMLGNVSSENAPMKTFLLPFSQVTVGPIWLFMFEHQVG